MKVLKFGGSSLADAVCFEEVANIIHHYSQHSAIAIVVSAPQSITNDLVALIVNLTTGKNSEHPQQIIQQKLSNLLNDAIVKHPNINREQLSVAFEALMVRLNQLVQGAKLLSHCPQSTQAQILSSGEKFSVLRNWWSYCPPSRTP